MDILALSALVGFYLRVVIAIVIVFVVVGLIRLVPSRVVHAALAPFNTVIGIVARLLRAVFSPLSPVLRLVVRVLRVIISPIAHVMRTDARPNPRVAMILSFLPFVLLVSLYAFGAYLRHHEDPDDKILPLPTKIFEQFSETGLKTGDEELDKTISVTARGKLILSSLVEGVRQVVVSDETAEASGVLSGIHRALSSVFDWTQHSVLETPPDAHFVQLWLDLGASVTRFILALIAIMFAVIVGVNMGLLPYMEVLFYRFLVFFDKIPTVALLPILFIVFGIGELSKFAVVVIGVFPTVALDSYLQAKSLPPEQLNKARTLGASQWEIVYRVALPQIWPKMLNSIRLNFKSAWNLLLVGESIAASSGLGYRIYVVRRYLAMDVILLYVVVMTILLFAADWAVSRYIKRHYVWLDK